MCGLLGAIVHGECHGQHDLLPEDEHDAYLSDSQWRHQSINGREKEEGGEVCVCVSMCKRWLGYFYLLMQYGNGVWVPKTAWKGYRHLP